MKSVVVSRSLIVRLPLVGRGWLALRRFKTAAGYFRRPLADLATWLVRSRETTNFTYDLDDLNKRYLAAFVAQITNTSITQIDGYLEEILTDDELRGHIRARTLQSPFARYADAEARYGRRIGWYAVVRAVKPRVIVETGVDKGLGACVLTAALRRNETEGHPGRYFGTDRCPTAGFLLDGDYARFGEVLCGDSVESLRSFDHEIDVFINDSDHSHAYEQSEYSTVCDRLSDRALILGDNAHASDALLDFARRTNRSFLYFQEKPRAHWYPGAGIGAAFPAQAIR